MGFDANWEGGLDIARAKWKNEPNVAFQRVTSADEMQLSQKDVFQLAIAMETLEHVPPHLVDGYLQKIAQHLQGYFLVTVPNETGLVFLTKWLGKRLMGIEIQPYSFYELIQATLGRLHVVRRHEHKGFDYTALIANMARHFEIVEVSGHPFSFFPSRLCFSIGIIAKSKPI